MTEFMKKRRQLTLNEKLVLIDMVEHGKKLTAVAREFGISSSTASGIVKDKSKIKLVNEQYKLAPHRKRMRLSLYSDVDEAVYMWFKQMRAKNAPVNGPMLQQKAREFAQQLGHPTFEGSSGWLSRFRERHDMTVEEMRGEKTGDRELSEFTSLGMTDEEIVTTIRSQSQNNTLPEQAEYIVSHVDLADINGDEIYNSKIEETNGASTTTSTSDILPVNHCDSTDEVHHKKVHNDALPTVQLTEAIVLFKRLTAFFKNQSDIPKHVWDSLQNISTFMTGDLTDRLTQRKITEFFKVKS